MYQNQYGYPNQYGAVSGVGIQTMPRAKYTQALTPEEISRLRSKNDVFKIEVSEEDLLRAACTHKENGVSTLIDRGYTDDGNPIVQCSICGETFVIVDCDVKEVEAEIEKLYNMLQTAKTMYLDAPPSLTRQFYQLIPLLKKFPILYDRSQRNFAYYENAMGTTPGSSTVGMNGFQILGNMLANPYGGYGYQAPVQPVQPAPYPPQGGQYPPQQPAYPYPVQPAPYGYPAPMQPVDPNQNPLMYAPANPAPAPAPAPAPGTVPPATGNNEVSQQKQFKV